MNNNINLGTHSAIISTVPSLLGFVPTESFVLILLTDGDEVHCTLRGDITAAPTSVAAITTTAGPAFRDATSAILLAFCGPWNDPAATTILDTLRDALNSKNIHVAARIIARDANEPHQWVDIDTTITGAEMSNVHTLNPGAPTRRPIAADRDTIAAEFTPTINRAPICAQPLAAILVHTLEEIAAVVAGIRTPSASLATRAAIVITSSADLRDTMILLCAEQPITAAQLWTTLANQVTGEARLQALTLAATFHYLSSDTIRAGIALEIADNEAHATHTPYPRLARLLTSCLHAGISPTEMSHRLNTLAGSRDND